MWWKNVQLYEFFHLLKKKYSWNWTLVLINGSITKHDAIFKLVWPFIKAIPTFEIFDFVIWW